MLCLFAVFENSLSGGQLYPSFVQPAPEVQNAFTNRNIPEIVLCKNCKILDVNMFFPQLFFQLQNIPTLNEVVFLVKFSV